MKKVEAIEILSERFGATLCENAVASVPHGYIGIVNTEAGKRLICLTDGPCGLADKLAEADEQTLAGKRLQIAVLSPANAMAVRMFLKWTAPSACGKTGMSIGCRGLAAPEQLRALQEKGIKPVLVQASVQELAQTGSTFQQMLDGATWSVLEAGYQAGYGADGDQLQTETEVMDVLMAGLTMVTVDCSGKLDYSVDSLSEAALMERYQQLPGDFKANLEKSYLSKRFSAGSLEFTYTPAALARAALVYKEAIAYLSYIFGAYLTYTPWPIDLELSLSAAEKPLTLAEHFLLGNELTRLRVKLASFAPRLAEDLGAQLQQHAMIAKHHGYRMGIRVDGDKRQQLPLIAQSTEKNVHVKLSGDGCGALDLSAL